MSSALHVLLLFSALWTLSSCGTRQFHVVEVNKSCTEAQKYCRESFTDLATIESQEEMDAVKAVLNGTPGHFWIGRKVQDNNTIWVWVDGRNFSYSNWMPEKPNNNGEDDCGEIRHLDERQCNDLDCKHSNKFICYEEIPLILVQEKKTWTDALRYCRENHVDLVSVHSEKIQHWVEFVGKNASTVNVWVGLRQTCTLSFWFWVSGESICYQNWAPGNGTGVEDCSETERTGAVQTGSGKWVSLPETQTLNFICSIRGGLEGYKIHQQPRIFAVKLCVSFPEV